MIEHVISEEHNETLHIEDTERTLVVAEEKKQKEDLTHEASAQEIHYEPTTEGAPESKRIRTSGSVIESEQSPSVLQIKTRNDGFETRAPVRSSPIPTVGEVQADGEQRIRNGKISNVDKKHGAPSDIRENTHHNATSAPNYNGEDIVDAGPDTSDEDSD